MKIINKNNFPRYLSTSEAVWRTLTFDIHDRAPTVLGLAVHLENGQRVYFNENNAQRVIDTPRNTTLTAFFQLCSTDSFAATITYDKVAAYFTWDNKQFNRRKRGEDVEGFQGVKRTDALGRVYAVHPSNSECYHLRMLLHVIPGPVSFDSLKTVDGTIHATFKSACLALGLLENDNHWNDCLTEAALSKSANNLRNLFAVMLIFCHITDPLALWHAHKNSMSEDILHRERQVNSGAAYSEVIYNEALHYLQNSIQQISDKFLSDFGLPLPMTNLLPVAKDKEYLRELSYDKVAMARLLESNEPSLNNDQRIVYEQVLHSVSNDKGQLFFLDAPGGTGKTFVINLLLAKLRLDGKIVLAVASSGIAATLLEGGRTAHATFKLPLSYVFNESPVCNIPKQSGTAKLLRNCSLIIWDESTMANKLSFEALERTLRDIRSSNELNGKVTILLTGDFRQTLPVVPRGSRADEINACFKKSALWKYVVRLSLTTNMRAFLHGEDDERSLFASTLLKIGNGEVPEKDGQIDLLEHNICTVVDTVDELIQFVYPEVNDVLNKELSWFCERAILSPKNESANYLNNIILSRINTPEFIYNSFDSVVDTEEAVHFPLEFLHTLDPPGLPSHRLLLKVGTPIMLLRNLSPPKLCNGTRLQVRTLHPNVIEAIVITGCAAGEIVFIPRIPMIPSDFPIQFKRVQFPVKSCFVMTVNKAQGQTLQIAGIDLREDCFSHGQLYVACSRVSEKSNLCILAPSSATTNVVYKEALN